jgi:hypothetical protein
MKKLRFTNVAIQGLVAHTFIKNAERLRQTLSLCQKTDDNCFLGRRGILMAEFMQLGTTFTSGMWCETLQKLLWPIQHKIMEWPYMALRSTYSCSQFNTAVGISMAVA